MGALLVQQRRGFEGGLPGPDHDDPLAGERRQVGVGGTVRAGRGGQPGQFARQVREVLHPDGDDHLAGPERLPVAERELVASPGR